MDEKIHLQIMAPSGAAYDGPADYVQLPLEGGSVGILPRHAAFLGAVTEGVVKYTDGDGERYIAVTHGVAHVADNTVTVLVSAAEQAEDMKTARAAAVRLMKK